MSVSPLSQSNRPLWQLLLATVNRNNEVILSCEECFAILEYLADVGKMLGIDPKTTSQIARRYLASCPDDCLDFFEQRLEKWEAWSETGD